MKTKLPDGTEIEGTLEEIKAMMQLLGKAPLAEPTNTTQPPPLPPPSPPVEDVVEDEEPAAELDYDEERRVRELVYDPDEPLYYEQENGRKTWYWDAVFLAAEQFFLTNRGSPGVALAHVMDANVIHRRKLEFCDWLRLRGHGDQVDARMYEKSEEGYQNLVVNAATARTYLHGHSHESDGGADDDADDDPEIEQEYSETRALYPVASTYMHTAKPKVPGVPQPYVKGQTFIVEDWPYFHTVRPDEQEALKKLLGQVVWKGVSLTPYSFKPYGIEFEPFAQTWFPFLEELRKKSSQVAGYFGKPDAFVFDTRINPKTGKKLDVIKWSDKAEAEARKNYEKSKQN